MLRRQLIVATAAGFAAFLVCAPIFAKSILITNDPDLLFGPEVGTKGIQGFDPRKHYNIIMSPVLDKSEKLGVKIPSNMYQAATELVNALPKSYVKSLRFRTYNESDGTDYVWCSGGDEEKDDDVSYWMIKYWRLKYADSPLRRFFTKEVYGSENPMVEKIGEEDGEMGWRDNMASDVLMFVCRYFQPGYRGFPGSKAHGKAVLPEGAARGITVCKAGKTGC